MGKGYTIKDIKLAKSFLRQPKVKDLALKLNRTVPATYELLKAVKKGKFDYLLNKKRRPKI